MPALAPVVCSTKSLRSAKFGFLVSYRPLAVIEAQGLFVWSRDWH